MIIKTPIITEKEAGESKELKQTVESYIKILKVDLLKLYIWLDMGNLLDDLDLENDSSELLNLVKIILRLIGRMIVFSFTEVEERDLQKEKKAQEIFEYLKTILDGLETIMLSLARISTIKEFKHLLKQIKR